MIIPREKTKQLPGTLLQHTFELLSAFIKTLSVLNTQEAT